LNAFEDDVLPIAHLDTLISETSLAATTSEKQAIAPESDRGGIGGIGRNRFKEAQEQSAEYQTQLAAWQQVQGDR